MPSLNKVFLMGHVGQDPSIKEVGEHKVVEISIATNTKSKGEEQTVWHGVQLWDRQADIAIQYVKKGTLLFVEGRIAKKEWKDKEGKPQHKTYVVASEMRMLGGKNTDIESRPNITDEDIPF